VHPGVCSGSDERKKEEKEVDMSNFVLWRQIFVGLQYKFAACHAAGDQNFIGVFWIPGKLVKMNK
jgi:hypothetical protein